MEKLKTFLYENGLPFPSDLVDDIIDLKALSNLKRVPSILIIDGAPGTGKTTLGVHIMDVVNGKDTELVGDVPQVAMGGDSLIKKAEQCHKLGLKAILFDEADLDKRGSLTKYNSNLFGFFREYRSLGILIIICIQNVSWLDNRIWELGAVDGLIHLYNPQEGYTDYTVYDLENLSYLLYRMDKMGMQRRKAYSIVKGYKRGHFLPLPNIRQAQLDSLSNQQKATSRRKRTKAVKNIPISTSKL